LWAFGSLKCRFRISNETEREYRGLGNRTNGKGVAGGRELILEENRKIKTDCEVLGHRTKKIGMTCQGQWEVAV